MDEDAAGDVDGGSRSKLDEDKLAVSRSTDAWDGAGKNRAWRRRSIVSPCGIVCLPNRW